MQNENGHCSFGTLSIQEQYFIIYAICVRLPVHQKKKCPWRLYYKFWARYKNALPLTCRCSLRNVFFLRHLGLQPKRPTQPTIAQFCCHTSRKKYQSFKKSTNYFHYVFTCLDMLPKWGYNVIIDSLTPLFVSRGNIFEESSTSFKQERVGSNLNCLKNHFQKPFLKTF